MSKVRRQIQFSMSSLVLLLTVSCVGLGVWLVWSSKIQVLVATEDLDYKTKITVTNVEFQRWPKELVPPGAITAEDGIPVGLYSTTRLRKGQAVIRDDLLNRTILVSFSIPSGCKVLNIKVPNDIAHGSIRPGDRVDVTSKTGDKDGDSQHVICKGIKVFNIGSSASGNKTTGIVGLLLNEDQANAIVDAKKELGQFRLTQAGNSP